MEDSTFICFHDLSNNALTVLERWLSWLLPPKSKRTCSEEAHWKNILHWLYLLTFSSTWTHPCTGCCTLFWQWSVRPALTAEIILWIRRNLKWNVNHAMYWVHCAWFRSQWSYLPNRIENTLCLVFCTAHSYYDLLKSYKSSDNFYRRKKIIKLGLSDSSK